MAPRVVLVEIQPRRPADGVAVPLRVIGGATTRADHFGLQWFPALLRFPRLSSRLGFDGRAFGDGAISTIGDITISLGSAALTPFASYIFDRALVTVKTGPADGADGAFVDLWSGRAAGAVVAGKQLVVRLADPAEDLRVTALPNQFAGTGGIEGPADLKGRVKPRAWGTCEGVPAILIDSVNGIYLLVEGQATVSAVYDGGVAFTAGPTAVDLAALQALAVPAGAVATSSSAAGTLIRPWTRPAFTMTADIVAGALTKPAEIAQAIVASRSAIAFAAGTVAAFDAAQPGPIGVFIDDERTLIDELDRIFAGLGSWWNLSAAGEIELGQFAFSPSAQSFDFNVADINRARVLTPTRRRLVGYRRNFRPLTDSEIAGAIKAADLSGTIDWQTQVGGAGKPVDNATRNNVSSGTATPAGGADGDLYYETDAQAWWSRIGGVWQKVSDATAANIAAGIAGQGALATLNSADWTTQIAGAGKPADNATRNNVSSGTATPAGGVNGDLYHETDAQAWWSRIGGIWFKVSDATAANIAAGIAGQGALATLNSADWSTQIAGAGKPADNATRNNVSSGTATPAGGVNGDLYYETDAQAWWSRIGGLWQKVSDATAANIAAGIAGQGALATLNSADWQTQVGGAGKPENNADVTSARLGGGPSNANFEAGDVDWVPAAGWSIVNDPANAHAGSFVAKFTGVASGALRNRFTIGAPNGYPTSAGERFFFGGFVKTSAGATFGGAGWRVSFRDAAGVEVTTPTAFITAASTAYTYVRGVAVAPAGAAFAVLEGFALSWVTGTIYIDDGFMTPLTRDVDDIADGATYKRTTGNEKTGGGRAFAALVSNTRLNVNVLKEQQSGGTPRELPIGGGGRNVRDGSPVNFSQAWSGPPLLRHEGGVSFDPALSGKQEQVFIALNASTTGYTPSLRIKALSSSVPQNEGPFVNVGGTPQFQREKNIAAEDKNDTYIFNVTVSADPCSFNGNDEPGFLLLGFYTRSVTGGVWTKRTEVGFNFSGTYQVSVSVDGLGIDAAFGIHVEAVGLCAAGLVSGSILYDTGSSGGESSATPTGAADARSFLLGNQSNV